MSLIQKLTLLLCLLSRVASGTDADIYSKDFAPDFIIPDRLQAGDMFPFRYKRDNTLVDNYARGVALPPELTESIALFTKESGLDDVFQQLADGMNVGEGKLMKLGGNRQWSILPPDGVYGENWPERDGRKFFWIDAANEESFEESLKVLARGNFDLVLEAMAKEFGHSGYTIGALGFICVSKIHEGDLHVDMVTDQAGVWMNLLLPIHIPDPGAHIFISSDDDVPGSKIEYSPNVGILMEADTSHATGACDYMKSETRPENEFRVTATIYVMSVNEDNIDDFASDGSTFFPPNEMAAFHWANRDRFVKRGSLKNDVGRYPMENLPLENTEYCKANKHLCDFDLTGIRQECWKTCKVFVDDEEYFTKFFPNSRNIDTARKGEGKPKMKAVVIENEGYTRSETTVACEGICET